MPEGDTLYRTATVLRQVLRGTTIISATTANNPRDDRTFDASALLQQSVDEVESRGKHLLIHLENGSVIHSHLGMTGSWHTYHRGERWQKPAARAALALENDKLTQVVCFTPKTLELLTATSFRRHPWLSRLGPDILSTSLDLNSILRRFRAINNVPLGVAIMNQTVISGIGNIYKSEVLFVERRDPFAPVASLADADLYSLIETAASLMRRNLDGRRRTTRFRPSGTRMWVYDRAGEPCLQCGTMIAMRRQGDLGRSTYFCPKCQAAN